MGKNRPKEASDIYAKRPLMLVLRYFTEPMGEEGEDVGGGGVVGEDLL